MKNLNIKKIGIIALAGNCERESVLSAKSFFEKMGIKAELSKNIFDTYNYLAGSDEDKVSELHRFFSDSSIDLILNARGGYGSLRLIDKIDYELIKRNPKPFCGFSDITALLLMIYKKTGMITYHSPMACSDFADNISDFTYDSFVSALNNNHTVLTSEKIYYSGTAEGILWGGNLSTVVSLCGKDFIPDENFIFFAEDLNEPVYKIDRIFTQLFNIKEFKLRCKGIVLGEFMNVDNELWFEDFVKTLSEAAKIPIASGYKITHNKEKITIPIGKYACINNNELSFPL